MQHATTETIELKPIGYVTNRFENRVPRDVSRVESTIHIDPELRDGLLGLKQGAELLVVFWFHKAHGFDLLQHPRGDRRRRKRGVFALRSPRRPNGIGITVVSISGIRETTLRVVGLDALDGTPVLDLKPMPS